MQDPILVSIYSSVGCVSRLNRLVILFLTAFIYFLLRVVIWLNIFIVSLNRHPISQELKRDVNLVSTVQTVLSLSLTIYLAQHSDKRCKPVYQ